MPYFFSDQYDMGMEYSGYVEAGTLDQVVFRGEVAERKFIAFWLDRWSGAGRHERQRLGRTDAIAALVRSGRPSQPGRLADPEVALERPLRQCS